MKKLLLLYPFITFLFSATFAQNITYQAERFTFERAIVANMSDDVPDWEVDYQNLEMPKPGSQSTRAQLRKLKMEARKRFPLKVSWKSNYTTVGTTADSAILGASFEGNLAQNSVPNDNDLAISNDGMVVSVINSRVNIYDLELDSLMESRSLGSFVSGMMLLNSKYDPKVIYDPVADRFILVFLIGYTYQTSRIAVCFSQTSDPLGDWNVYALNGNPIDNDTWSDYPVVGISEDELFIGINTFYNGSTNNSGFVESCLWQISKANGYSGEELDTKYYHDILGTNHPSPVFNITPIQGGSGLYGPHMYLLSNRNLAIENDTVFVLEITNTLDNPNSSLQLKTAISSTKYFLPPEARQYGQHKFDTNDSRVLGGFYENGQIQFVQSCMDTTTGLAGIFHGLISNLNSESPVISGTVLGDTILDYGFPNISYSGLQAGDIESIITFNFTSPDDYSGFAALYHTNSGEYSNILRIKEGENYVNVLNGFLERWGDYSGSQPKYDEPGTVWTVGSFGKPNKKHGTWIAELSSPDSIRPPQFPSTEIKAYPNPASDIVNLNFTLESTQEIEVGLYDLQGKLVRNLFTDQAKGGQNVVSFSIAPLPAGIYIATITAGDKVILNEKVLKHQRGGN